MVMLAENVSAHDPRRIFVISDAFGMRKLKMDGARHAREVY